MDNDIGRHSYSMSEIRDGVHVGAFSSIAGGVHFHAKCNHPSIRNRNLVSNYSFREKWSVDYPESAYGKGDIYVGSDVWIGEGARILDGVTIGDGSIVGAQAVVTKSVPPYSVVVGNPGVIKKYRFPKKIRDKLVKIAWWNWDDDTIKGRINDLLDAYSFVEKYS